MKSSRLKCLYLFCVLIAQRGLAQGEINDSVPDSSLYAVKIHKNAFYGELAGNAGLYSLNYERFLVRKEKFILGARIGAGFLPNGKRVNQSYVSELNFCFGRRTFFFEAGLGYTLNRRLVESCDGKVEEVDNLHWGIIRAGIRFHTDEKGSLLRIGILPILYYRDSCSSETGFVTITGGISYGLLF